MFLGRVTGRLVPQVRKEGLERYKLLWVQPLNGDETDDGVPVIAIDTTGAGAGEMVFLVSSMEASLAALPEEMVPTDVAVIGIVDSVNYTDSTQDQRFERLLK